MKSPQSRDLLARLKAVGVNMTCKEKTFDSRFAGMTFVLTGTLEKFTRDAAAEMIVVAPFFLSGALFTPEQLANGFVTSVVLLVGLGTLIHSMLDYSISILIWKPVSLAVPRSTKA